MVMRSLVTGISVAFLLVGAARQPRDDANPPVSEQAGNVIDDVAFHPQERPLTCEAAALRMVLEHQGIVRSEATILSDIGVDRRPPYVDSSGTLHWGNPYTSFVGDPDGSERALTGNGTYYPNIARVARDHGATVLQAGENIAPATLYNALLANHPAVVWVSNDWAYHAESMPWVTFDGEQLSWHGPIEHAISLVGVSSTSVLVNNPALPTGRQWVPKRTFEEAYRTFGQMAVILR